MLKFSDGLWGVVLLLFCVVGWAGQASGKAKGTATYNDLLSTILRTPSTLKLAGRACRTGRVTSVSPRCPD